MAFVPPHSDTLDPTVTIEGVKMTPYASLAHCGALGEESLGRPCSRPISLHMQAMAIRTSLARGLAGPRSDMIAFRHA
jgi:hypothetical protein